MFHGPEANCVGFPGEQGYLSESLDNNPSQAMKMVEPNLNFAANTVLFQSCAQFLVERQNLTLQISFQY